VTLSLERYPDIDYHAERARSDDLDEVRLLRKWEAAIGYRIFSALRWGQLGDGHISVRDPEFTDHFWLLGYGIPFWAATVHNMALVGPDGRIVDGPDAGGVNTAGYNIHGPVLATHPNLVSAAHTHTQFGTPWSANVEPFSAISQESCSFVGNQAIYHGEDLEVATIEGGQRIAEAMGGNNLIILRNHGLLTGGLSPAEAVGWFVLAERVAEVHVKATNPKPISDEMAKVVAEEFTKPAMAWRTFQWLARDLVPDPSVVL